MKQHFDQAAGQGIEHEPRIGFLRIFPEAHVFLQVFLQDLTVFDREGTAVVINEKRLEVKPVFIKKILERIQQMCMGVVRPTILLRDPEGFFQKKKLMLFYGIKNVPDRFEILVEGRTMNAVLKLAANQTELLKMWDTQKIEKPVSIKLMGFFLFYRRRLLTNWFRMIAIKELYNVTAASVHIEVDIPLFKIRRNGFPDFHFRVKLFHLTPRSITDSFTMHFRTHEQKFQIAPRTIRFMTTPPTFRPSCMMR